MTRHRLRLSIILLWAAAVIGCVLNEKDVQQLNANPNKQTAPALNFQIPDAHWEPVFFETLAIRMKETGIPSLRSMELPDHDLEVRFWYDHFEIIQGLLLRRSGENWSATYLRPKTHRDLSLEQKNLKAPKSGWEDAWKRLTDTGILVLPDGSTTTCRSGVLDGIGYVVETNVNRTYRTYRYDNPQFANCDEARRILSIESIMSEEFGIPPQK